MIYCLLGAAMYGWRMVGADVTNVAVEWAARNVASNPQLAPLLEVRSYQLKSERHHGGPDPESRGMEPVFMHTHARTRTRTRTHGPYGPTDTSC
jgi:hypothetical protein